MVDSDFTDAVTRSLRDRSRDVFDERVSEQAERLSEEVQTGRLDSPGFGIGLELEVYAADGDGRLARLPDAVFDAPCARELGRHNAELNTSPDSLTEHGLETQATALRQRYRETQQAASEDGLDIVLDAMWTVPPAMGSEAYFGDIVEDDGIVIAENMTRSPRYTAIDNDILRRTGGTVSVSVPGAEVTAPTILIESLTSSIQPHLQIPDASQFPQYYNTAIATLGPVLALATNSPLLPLDYYADSDPETVLAETHHELRIPVFEEAINGPWKKVRFPDRIETTTDILDNLVADATCAPFLREWITDGDRESFDDQYWELDHKRGTYWRWLRGVTGGQPVGDGDVRSIRIEYRPLPAQPTVADNVAFLALVAGLVRGLVATDHPVEDLAYAHAERSFYNAVEDGLDAELTWITADGEQTTDSDVIYEELFSVARRGLRESGLSASAIESYLSPIEARWANQRTPSQWKLETVREAFDDGASFEDAVREMQATYNRRSAAETPFIEWPSP